MFLEKEKQKVSPLHIEDERSLLQVMTPTVRFTVPTGYWNIINKTPYSGN